MEWNPPFSNGIFLAEKWLNTDLQVLPAPDFWNGMESGNIPFKFQI
jgi:hypothetical protein